MNLVNSVKNKPASPGTHGEVYTRPGRNSKRRIKTSDNLMSALAAKLHRTVKKVTRKHGVIAAFGNFKVSRNGASAATLEQLFLTSLAQAAQALPQGVIALHSALHFHHLSPSIPKEVWVLSSVRSWPKPYGVHLRVLHAKGSALVQDVEKYPIENVMVPITSQSRTVVDCFRFRSRTGMATAIEALNAYLRKFPDDVALLRAMAQRTSASRVLPAYLDLYVSNAARRT